MQSPVPVRGVSFIRARPVNLYKNSCCFGKENVRFRALTSDEIADSGEMEEKCQERYLETNTSVLFFVHGCIFSSAEGGGGCKEKSTGFKICNKSIDYAFMHSATIRKLSKTLLIQHEYNRVQI